ncbi:DUF3291 domain-containing protein [Rhodococcus sp. D2-41]|uniref:DUF3291 domain-containing protein n=1 Tax=Speluncibacter jeojiensis TaxID=2710754 RepID=A0A9X4RFS3_9ACTN|nr:hypothetical protein [Rhodococcus sp. D2-41]MDG3009289.1 DUF3291 domain-containing protein [Rhodococcus sp. D2-41]MDG3016924.1 hypothetical protein [Corynebacteriales bacterium D3-21]
MPTIPWTTPKDAAIPPEVVVMASRFDLQSLAQVPAFLRAAMRIRAQMLGAPGVVGLSLIARPLHKTFFTLSAWSDRGALDKAVAHRPHVDTMTNFHPKMAGSTFAFWTAPGTSLPLQWPEAMRRLDAER